MFYYTYKITNKLNGNYYFGRRKSKIDPVKDPYFGSGLGLKQAIKKYGKENFQKEVLCIYETFDALVEAEQTLITIEVVRDPSCYNQSLGGPGGVMVSDEIKQKVSSSLKKSWKNNPGRSKQVSQSNIDTSFNKWWQGKTRSEEDKLAKSKSTKRTIELGTHPSKVMATCPHCSYTTGIGNAKRWHFDNCKQKVG